MDVKKAIDALINIISDIPESKYNQESDCNKMGRQIIEKAALKAAVISAGLSLPKGPAGILTILPDLTGIWKLQRNMVADLAAVYGKTTSLNREQMLFCLFRHSATQVVRDITMRGATRITVEQSLGVAIEQILNRIGIHLSRKTTSKLLFRVIPIVGSVGAGMYAYFDTAQVGKTARELFTGKN